MSVDDLPAEVLAKGGAYIAHFARRGDSASLEDRTRGMSGHVCANQGGGISAYVLGPSGLLTAVSGSPFTDNGQPVSIVVDPSDRFVYVANYNGAFLTSLGLDDREQSPGDLFPVVGGRQRLRMQPRADHPFYGGLWPTTVAPFVNDAVLSGSASS